MVESPGPAVLHTVYSSDSDMINHQTKAQTPSTNPNLMPYPVAKLPSLQNIRVMSKYYTQISIKRMASLLMLSYEVLTVLDHLHLAPLVQSSRMLVWNDVQAERMRCIYLQKVEYFFVTIILTI